MVGVEDQERVSSEGWHWVTGGGAYWFYYLPYLRGNMLGPSTAAPVPISVGTSREVNTLCAHISPGENDFTG